MALVLGEMDVARVHPCRSDQGTPVLMASASGGHPILGADTSSGVATSLRSLGTSFSKGAQVDRGPSISLDRLCIHFAHVLYLTHFPCELLTRIILRLESSCDCIGICWIITDIPLEYNP